MNVQSDWLWIESIKGSRRISNYFWALVLSLGALGFLLVGVSSYLGKDLLSFLPSQQVLFAPQGLVMCFYGIAGLFLAFYLWCAILWNVGSGYNEFDKENGIISLFRWGFPGENRQIRVQCSIQDVQALRLEVREGISPRRVLYIRMKGQQEIALNRLAETLTLKEVEEKTAQLARFLRVSIEGL